MKPTTSNNNKDLLIYLMYSMLYANDLACNEAKELEVYVCSKDKETKKIYGALTKRTRNYLSTVNKILGESVYGFSEYCAAMDDRVDGYVQDYSDVLDEAFKDAGVDNYKYLAKAQMVYSLFDMAVYVAEKVVSRASEIHKDGYMLEAYTLREHLKVCHNLVQWIVFVCKMDKDVHLDKNERVVNAMTKLTQALFDAVNFQESYNAYVEYIKQNDGNTFRCQCD